MIIAVLSGIFGATAAPLIYRLARRHTGWVIGALPAALFGYFLTLIGPVSHGEVVKQAIAWAPSLGIELAFAADGLSLLLALLVSGIGALIMVYGGAYLEGDENMPRFYVVVLIFMAAMLGLVLADNIFTLFIFWELTSISSYILIGYKHEKEKAQKAALQALLVTGIGGLAMLAGLVLLGTVAGTFTLSELPAQAEVIQSSQLYLPILILVLLGAFTKSAQFPFHFWLPGAMEAPTPVSAYLHSATMVKAGVYLVARLGPTLGGTPEWVAIVTGFGAVTMLIGAYLGVQMYDVKRILAYSTVSALGIMVMLFGIGTEEAAKAGVTFIAVHSFYKGAMFMVAGAIDHETGTRDIRQLGGLIGVMPVLGVAIALAAISKAGIPPALGFLAKEVIYDATLLHSGLSETWSLVLTGLAVVSNALIAVTGYIVTLRPFLGEMKDTPHHPHAAPFGMVLGPVVLALAGLVTGLLPERFSEAIVSPGTAAVLGESVEAILHYPTGISEVVILSTVTILLGIGGYIALEAINAVFRGVNFGEAIGPARIYDLLYQGTLDLAEWVTSRLQTGNIRQYIFAVVLTFVALFGSTLLLTVDFSILPPLDLADVQVFEWILAGVILMGTVTVVSAKRTLVAVVGLGVVGYGVAMIFMLFSAPDLAMTQFAVETLSVILFVLVLYNLPDFARLSGDTARRRDILLAAAVGLLITSIVLLESALPLISQVSPYYIENSVPAAQGRNIVNVILVDFRALDTLGEITVLSVAALGVFALLRLTWNPQNQLEKEEPDDPDKA